MKTLSVVLSALIVFAPAAEAAKKSAHEAEGKRFVVAADHPAASEAGLKMLKDGGNVVDAAVAAAFALAVARPYSAGLGGGGFMLIHQVGQPPLALDYRETAPAAAVPENYLDADGNPVPEKSVRGHWAAAVPGQVAGLTKILRERGTLTLAEVMAPAIRLAEEGVVVDEHARSNMEALAAFFRRMREEGHSHAYREAASIFLKPNGNPYNVGEKFKQPDLAKSLRMIAVDGAPAFYEKAIARRILSSMSEYSGPFQRGDLEEYKPKERQPLRASFRGYEVLGMPPPSSGGVCVASTLQVMEGLSPQAPDAEYWGVFAEALKHAFADRSAHMGDADRQPEVLEAVRRMLSAEHAEKVRAASSTGKTRGASEYGSTYLRDDHGTTHFSIMDSEGNAVAATETINTAFGSMVVPEETGIVLNNEIDDFTIKVGQANYFGLKMSEKNLVAPNARPLSSMSPTILVKDGKAVLAAGAAGGPRIITATLQSILRIVDRGQTPGDAVAAKRIHHQWWPQELFVEEGYPGELQAAFSAAGHKLSLEPDAESAAQVVYRKDGKLYGASDPRIGGRPAAK